MHIDLTAMSTGRLPRFAAGAAAGAGLALGLSQVKTILREQRIERDLAQRGPSRSFRPELLPDLPGAAKRYLLHSIAPGTRLTTSVRLRLTGQMRPRPGADLVDLCADEVLNPMRGFLWKAHFKMGILPVRVTDYYYNQDAGVAVTLLGIIPIGAEQGLGVVRSSRQRAAAESVWIPSVLMPSSRVRWTGRDDGRVTATMTIDSEDVSLDLTVDEVGRLLEISTQRYGKVGVPDWQPIPYGFTVEEEGTFDGHTIPTRIRGGWWFGTDRYDPDAAAVFNVVDARY